ncbi:MAG: glycosyltransferase [Bacteroidales bacterium]|nr:glycosyltransferase [Bacteroidales bacterium]
MKILHISTSDSSGAGLCAYRINKALNIDGIDSKMLVLYKSQSDESVIRVFKRRNYFLRLFHFMMRKLGLYVFEYDKLVQMSARYNIPFTRPVTPFDLSKHPLVKEADVIHFHWVDDFFDQNKFLQRVKKPIVWTLHDEGMFYGIRHYQDKILHHNSIEQKYVNLKLKMTQKAYKLHFVLLSEYFKRNFGDSKILAGHDFSVISNSVDCSKFTAFDRNESRDLLGLGGKEIYLSFLAANIADSRKRLDTLIEAVKIIDNDKIRIIAIGNNAYFKEHSNVITPGIIRDSTILSRYLSASDYFVMPSLKEAFSQAPIEAMACGKPAIVTPVSGTEELITDANGVICNGFSANDIAEGIKLALTRVYDADYIRKDVEDRFSPKVIVAKYKKIYEDCLKN